MVVFADEFMNDFIYVTNAKTKSFCPIMHEPPSGTQNKLPNTLYFITFDGVCKCDL